MKNILITIASILLATHVAATTLNNDDSCDIATMPAATLLLPNFEVDLNSPAASARTTLFTIVNTSQYPQIARVTLWTDWAYPVLNFNIFLTGYDAQAINLYDVLSSRGVIAPPNGTSSTTDPGSRSLANTANPNFAATASATCATMPGTIPPVIVEDIRNALTIGLNGACQSSRVGGTHSTAMGYVTIDVVSTCSTTLPTDERYYNEILFDNVLTGDWQIVDPNASTGNYAGGNPLVHIRAIPEGGPAGAIVSTNLPYTFYDRYTPQQSVDARAMDRRQPLPAVFSTRYIQGSTALFNTDLRIWREGISSHENTCTDFATNTGLGMKVADLVRFDEHENPTTLAGGIVLIPQLPPTVVLPATSKSATSSAIFPPMSTAAGDTGGWLYLNLNNGGSLKYSVKPDRNFAVNNTVVRPNQNWMVTSMSAEGRYQVAFDAVMLSNGCTPAPGVTSVFSPIAPSPNSTP